jgi:hypothetical protein
MWNARAENMEKASSLGNTRELFQQLRSAAGKKSGISDVIQDSAGNVITNLDERVSRWREFYSQLLNRPPPSQRFPDMPSDVSVDMNDEPPTLEEVKKAINRLKYNKAAGEDGILPELFKHCGSDLTAALLDLIRSIWSQERIPTDWETATVIPFFKKGDKTICKNYRGISLLDIALKILEIILLFRISPYRETHCRENQAGFRPGRGCVDQIFTLRQILETRHDFRQTTVVCFVDFKAAFDSVFREGLWSILRSEGVPTKLIQIIKALYRDTRCTVRVYNTISDSFTIDSGVRQGSCLSPLLFNYAVDWSIAVALNLVKDAGVTLSSRQEPLADLEYADDIALLASSEPEMQSLLDHLANAAEKIGLEISSEKTKVMSCCAPATPVISLNGLPLETVEKFRYLGSEIEPDGDIASEISARIGRAQGAFNLLRECLWNRKDIRASTKARVYDACIRSVLLYGCESWPFRGSEARRLAVFEHRCWRNALGISLLDRVPNETVAYRFYHQKTLDSIIKERRLRWLGHVLRMPEFRLPRQALLAGPLRGWKRPAGGQKTTWKRTVMRDVEPHVRPPRSHHKTWNRDWLDLTLEHAVDRVRWRATVRDLL